MPLHQRRLTGLCSEMPTLRLIHTRLCRRPRLRLVCTLAASDGEARGSSNGKARLRVGGSCKAGVRWYLLPHDGRCRRAPQLRAIGGPICRAALRLETGRATGTCSRVGTAHVWHIMPHMQTPTANFGHACVVLAGRAGWMGRTCDLRWASTSPGRLPVGGAGRLGARGRRGRVDGPGVLGGKSRHNALVAPLARAGIRGASLGRDPFPRHRIRPKSQVVAGVWKSGGLLRRFRLPPGNV